MPFSWHLLTGEYPPQAGGVADYSRLVASALAAAGDEVHVWTSECAGVTPVDAGVSVHRLPGHFGWRALRQLGQELERLPPERVLLVQYVPHAFGWKAMNLTLAWWLWRRRRREAIWVMFHEVAFPLSWRQPWHHNLIGWATRLMACLVSRSARRTFVAIPGWAPQLSRSSLWEQEPVWLPVPSNLPAQVSPERRAAVREKLTGGGERVVIGHFGTFGPTVGRLLVEPLVRLLRPDERRLGLLLGQGSESFARELRSAAPDVGGRLIATGALEAEALAAHLSACDLLLQPYPDGASCRRGSLMAGLALGLPIVTTAGRLTEPIWRESGAVVLSALDTSSIAAAAEATLADAELREILGREAAKLYRKSFAIEHTVQALRAIPSERNDDRTEAAGTAGDLIEQP